MIGCYTLRAALLSTIFLALSCTKADEKSQTSGASKAVPTIASVDDADKYLTGTWTFCPKNLRFSSGDHVERVSWFKFVCQSDHSLVIYRAPPSADDWGTEKYHGKWAAKTGKYSDSGERYYGMDIKVQDGPRSNDGDLLADFMGYFILQNGELEPRGSAGHLSFKDARLTKGDATPFSK